MQSKEVQSLKRLTLVFTILGLGAKALLFLAFFLWARTSEVGAGALRGAVAADVFTWILFSMLAWPFRRLQVSAGALFELVLVVLYFNRESLFSISTDIEAMAISMLFFFLVLFGKAAAWSVEHTLEISGVKESGSP